MRERELPTCRVDLHLAGELSVIEQTCREYCHRVGLCVTVQPQRFLYTGGQEDGARVGLIDYPRFPKGEDALWSHAHALALLLADRACQHSVLLEGPTRTVWLSRRDEGAV